MWVDLERIWKGYDSQRFKVIGIMYGGVVLKYMTLQGQGSMSHSDRIRNGYEKDFKDIDKLLYKGYTVSEMSNLLGMNIHRIYDIFKYKGFIYDSNIGKTYITKRCNTLTIESLSSLGASNKSKVYNIHCSVCSKDKELFPQPFTSTVERLNLGKVPCACSGNYGYNDDQKILRLARALEGSNYTLLSLGKKSFNYDCADCGVRNKSMRYITVLNNGGKLNCKCFKGYNYSNLEERLLDLNKILIENGMDNLTAVDYDKKTGEYSFTCDRCSVDQELWGNVVLVSTKNQILEKYFPCGCKEVPVYSEDQYKILISRRCEEDGFVFNGFVGDYLKAQTLLSITCKNGHTRNTTKITQFLNKNVNRCMDCKHIWARELYASDGGEIKRILSDSMLPQHTFLGFCGGEFINQNQKFKYFCSEHHKVYKRTIRSFLDGSKGSCCSGGGFKENLKGYLYFVRWCDDESGFLFYKYGISNHNPLKRIKTQVRKTIAKPLYVGGFLFDLGEDAVLLEHSLKDIYKNCRVSFEDLPDGFTETIRIDDFTDRDILNDFVYLTGINIFNGFIYTTSKDDISLPFKAGFIYVDYKDLVTDLGGINGI